MHAVVVHADLHLLIGGAVAAIRPERRHVARHTDGFAPHEHRNGDITVRDRQGKTANGLPRWPKSTAVEPQSRFFFVMTAF